MKNEWSIFDAVLPKYLVNCRRLFTRLTRVALQSPDERLTDMGALKMSAELPIVAPAPPAAAGLPQTRAMVDGLSTTSRPRVFFGQLRPPCTVLAAVA